MDWSRLHPVAIATALVERERDISRLSRIREVRVARGSSHPAPPEGGALAATTPECLPLVFGGVGPAARVGLPGKPTSR